MGQKALSLSFRPYPSRFRSLIAWIQTIKQAIVYQKWMKRRSGVRFRLMLHTKILPKLARAECALTQAFLSFGYSSCPSEILEWAIELFETSANCFSTTCNRDSTYFVSKKCCGEVPGLVVEKYTYKEGDTTKWHKSGKFNCLKQNTTDAGVNEYVTNQGEIDAGDDQTAPALPSETESSSATAFLTTALLLTTILIL